MPGGDLEEIGRIVDLRRNPKKAMRQADQKALS
jgi:hypothetical protein